MTIHFKPGDRVRHVTADLAGTVEKVIPDYVRVRWDHYGLAIAALGVMADLQRPDMLEIDASEGGTTWVPSDPANARNTPDERNA